MLTGVSTENKDTMIFSPLFQKSLGTDLQNFLRDVVLTHIIPNCNSPRTSAIGKPKSILDRQVWIDTER